MADYNVLSLFNTKPKSIAILMDEIDGMNSGDKGGINSLIKLLTSCSSFKGSLLMLLCKIWVNFASNEVPKKSKFTIYVQPHKNFGFPMDYQFCHKK